MLYRLLRSRLRPYRTLLIILLPLQTISALGMLTLPTLNADIIDKGVIQHDNGEIFHVGALMLLASLIQCAGTVGAVWVGAKVSMAVGRDLRAAVFARVQQYSAREIGLFGTPSLITRTTNDVQQVQMVALLALTLMLTAPIMCVGGSVMALRQSVPLSGVLLLSLPVMGLVFGVIVVRLRPLYRRYQTYQDTLMRILREQITGIRTVRAYVREESECERFDVANREMRTVSTRVGFLMTTMFPLAMLITNLSSVTVLWIGGHLVGDGSVSVGRLTAFLSYLGVILITIMLAVIMFLMMPRAEICAERIEEVLTTPTSLLPAENGIRDTAEHGTVELRGVTFGYPGAEHPVLRHIDLAAGPGEVVAITGSTGSGKTTLLHLVPRLADATEGTVLVDGVDVRELAPDRLAEIVGYVPQRSYLFSGTVASNLRFGRPDATDADLWNALRIAQASDFVATMPDGLESEIAQGGTNVSGGQRQRLAIARALVRRPEIYLFDDSFSALDYSTDAALRTALAAETRNATVIIVAQRITTILRADRIIVLDKGRVVGVGTHTELMASNTVYREIVLSQLTEQEAAA